MGSGERLSQSYLTYYKQYKSELSCMELGRDVSYIPQIINFDNVELWIQVNDWDSLIFNIL